MGPLFAVALLAVHLSASFGFAIPPWESEEIVPPPQPDPPAPQRSTSHVGPYALACGLGAATAEILSAGVNGSGENPRQSTPFEAGLSAGTCPALLPWTVLVAVTCPDNPATREIARLAWRYGLTHPSADWTPFTDAYGLACSDGRLPGDFLAFLRRNRLTLSLTYRRYLHALAAG